MDRMLNSKQEKETIYEIYRGCRLCGGGAGYKMPIVQNIVDLEDSDVELRQKIRECVQIEVHQDDKMPPLICELCVDKVNDFYEFLDMCRQTNQKTRLRLGLPPQSMPRGAPDTSDCILGLTEPVYVEDSDGDGEPLVARQKKTKIKKEPGLKEVKKEVEPTKKVKETVKKEPKKDVKKEPIKEPVLDYLQEGRSSRHTKRPRTPPRVTRTSRSTKDDEEIPSSLKEKPESPKVTPRPILKRDSSSSSRRESKTKDYREKGESESDDSSITSRKRSKDKELVKLETPSKKVKISTKAPQTLGQKPSPKPSPKPVKRAPTPPPKEDYNCTICGAENKTSQGRGNHLRTHTVGFTSPKLACNPCGQWFLTADEISAHHKRHRSSSFPYSCKNCYSDFKRLSSYEEHLQNNECIPTYEVPDMKCEECWHLFPTYNLMESHKCLGEDHRPGGKCGKCNRSYALLKNLKKHESTCTARKKGEPIVDEAILKKLLPMQVRISRCDSVLKKGKNNHCDTSNLPTDFGLDPSCFYPYLGLVRIKSEFKGMVNIEEHFKEFSPEDYIHWDSTDDESDDEITCGEALNSVQKNKKIESLTALCLKSIFSKKLLGKVPRKKRKFKPEKVFDYLNEDVKMDIDSIINNLDDDIEYKKDDKINSFANDSNDSGFKFDSVVNDSDRKVDENNDSKRNSDGNNDSTSKVNGDADANLSNINDGEIVFKPIDSDKDNVSVTSQCDKYSQENPSEVSSLDLLMENSSQDSTLSKNNDSNKNNGDIDIKGDVENNDSVNDNANNDTSNSSNNSKIVLSDILPKSTENEVTVSSINNFSFDF